MVEVKVTGSKAAKEMLEGIDFRRAEGTPFFGRASAIMFRDVQDHFRKEAGPDGAWQQWAPATKRARERGRGGDKILQDTGDLKDRMQLKHSKDNAEVASNLDYAVYHQEGTEKIPARPYMYMSETGAKELADDYGKFVADGKKP